MAQVDFSNAIIEPIISGNVNSSSNYYLNLNNGTLANGSGNSIVTSNSKNVLINEKKQFLILYQGTFTASGTEIYIRASDYSGWWRIRNISFSSGDTYLFQINATLTCN